MRITKRDRLKLIQSKMAEGAFESALDRELNVMRAAALVAAEIEHVFAPYGNDSDIPTWATENRRDTPSELQEAIDLMATRDPRRPAATVPGTRVSRTTHCAVRTLKVNGIDTIDDAAEVKYAGRTYSVDTAAVHPTRRQSEPKWSRSELDTELSLTGLQWHFSKNPRVLVVAAIPEYHVSDVFSSTDDGRTAASIAVSRQHVAINEAAAYALAVSLKAQKDAIRVDTRVAPIARPVVIPGPVFGATFATLRPRAKWFLVTAPPLLENKSATVTS